MCDDMLLTVKGWDRYVERQMNKFPGRLGVVSPAHNMGMHVDVPFVSKEWIGLFGWFCHPTTYHYVWPTVIGLLGESGHCIHHAPADKFWIDHHQMSDHMDSFSGDATGFYKLMMYGYYGLVAKLKNAIQDAKGIADGTETRTVAHV